MSRGGRSGAGRAGGKLKPGVAYVPDGGLTQTLDEEGAADTATPAREPSKTLPLEVHDLTLSTFVDYREGLIEYAVTLRNDGARPVEEVVLVPSVAAGTFRAEPASATLGPLAAGQSAGASFLLEPLEEFGSLVLSRPVIEGRDVEIRTSVRSRKGSITCEVELVNRQGIELKGIDVAPLLPEGFLATVPSKRVDLAARERMKLVFNVLPRSEFGVHEHRPRTAAFSPRGVEVRAPTAEDIQGTMPVELRPLPPYSRALVYKPGLKIESKAIRGLMARAEVREVLRAEEVVPEEIEVRLVKGVKESVRRPRAATVEAETGGVHEKDVSARRPGSRAKEARYEEPDEPSRATPNPAGGTPMENFDEIFRDEIRHGRELEANVADGQNADGSEEAATEAQWPADDSAGQEPADGTSAEEEQDGGETAVDPEHPPCPDCGNGLDWAQEYDRWYCYTCEKYPW